MHVLSFIGPNGRGDPRQVSAGDPLPVTLTEPAAGVSYTDGSGPITLGGTSQQIFAANPARRYIFVTNISDTDMWVNFGTAAVADQPSIKIPANGGFFEPLVPPQDAMNIICATTGKKFVAKQA